MVAAAAPIPADVVERWFSTRTYPPIQRALTSFSNLLPIALFDILLVAAAASVVVTIVRLVRAVRFRRRWTPILGFLWHLTTAAAAIYLVFLLVWGLNYRRVPLAERLVVNPGPPSNEAVVQLGLDAVARMNELHDAAHRAGWPRDEWRSSDLRNAFANAQRVLGDRLPAIPGRLKPTLLGPYFRWTGVDGMTNPFGLEVIVNPDLLPFERPFVAAHEWAHLAGYADESEANFVAWLASLRGGVPAQYSGWLFLYWQVNGEVGQQDRDRLAATLAAGPRRDVDAIIARIRRGRRPMLQAAGWAVYDQYLKANRVDAGIRSYGAVVTLILRARFDPGWVPVRRAPAPSR
jgi:hypothetical protein